MPIGLMGYAVFSDDVNIIKGLDPVNKKSLNLS